jgi:DNA-directed RNA polymerase subunit N (RpoN/RPB10)
VTDLHTFSREELIAIILRQREELLELRGQLAEVAGLTEAARLGKGSKEPPSWVKANRPPQEKKKRLPRKQSFGRHREPPDEVIAHALERCPDCGRKLHDGWVHGSRQVIEIPPTTKKVIEHVFIARYCGICQKRWVPQVSAAELGVQGKRRFGIGVQSLVAALHGHYRLPLEQIRGLFAEVYGLGISKGEIVGLLEGVAQAGEKEMESLQEAVRGSPVVCGDETGWRQNGKNGWLWTFSTPTIRYFVYRDTRSGSVPEEVLGKEFRGKLVCDFYAAYNRMLTEIQRCWAHLLRDLHALKEKLTDHPKGVAWVEAIQRLYREARAFASPNPHLRKRKREQLEARLERLVSPLARRGETPQGTLAQRMKKHLGELFVFVEHPEVPATNNQAERSLRPAVIARKISGGTRSEKGSKTQTSLMSLFGTWTLREYPLLQSCQRLLLTGSPT